VQIDLGEAFAHHVQQPGLVELVHLQVKLKLSKMSRTAGVNAWI
jgi:hypothetical protein